jgi:hypothetical protein
VKYSESCKNISPGPEDKHWGLGEKKLNKISSENSNLSSTIWDQKLHIMFLHLHQMSCTIKHPGLVVPPNKWQNQMQSLSRIMKFKYKFQRIFIHRIPSD